MKLRIGVDFDNTLISYDEVFRDLAARRGWLPKSFPASKEKVKARLLKEDGNDLRWQRLQADAYGEHILKAEAFPGGERWLKSALKEGHEVYVVSHKSETSNLDRSVRLREKARQWLKTRKLMVNGHADPLKLKAENVLFEGTRDEKVAAIARLKLDVFIDDLLPVLEHPKFPKGTLPVHFGPHTSWKKLAGRLEALGAVGPAAAAAIQKIFRCAPVAAEPIAGGNNRLLKVRLENGKLVLVKGYLVDARDSRDRAGAEAAALKLLRAHGITCVPELFYKSPDGAFTLMSVLPGRPMKGRGARVHVLQAARFAARLAKLPQRGAAEAADSRRSLADYPRHLERRLSKILAGLSQPAIPAEARRFVREEVVPLKARLIERFEREAAAAKIDIRAPLPAKERILSPSDFGFHNAVLSPKGQVQFLDFEYFGCDDPAKLAADFTHHVGQKVSPELRALFVSELSKSLPKGFARRFALVEPLVGLEWLLIVLNVLAPEQLARRKFSNPAADARALIDKRLALARRIIRRLS